MPRLEHSSSEELLKGTEFVNENSKAFGKEIKAIIKGEWEEQRVIKFTDGTQLRTNKDTVKALIDVELDVQNKPVAMDSLTVHRDGSAEVKIGGPIEGEYRDYSNKSNALRAVNNHYSEDFDKYKEIYEEGGRLRRCKR